MLVKILIVCILASAASFIVLELVEAKNEAESDPFEVEILEGFELKSDYRILSNYLQKETESLKPNENFDIVLDSLISDLKKGVSPKTRRLKAARLFLSLMTINDENQCNFHSHNILKQNCHAVHLVTSALHKQESDDRIIKILSIYIDQHAQNCIRTYLERFKDIYPRLDEQIVKQVETFTAKAIEKYTSRFQDHFKPEYVKTFSHRLFNIIQGSFANFAINDEYINEALATYNEERAVKSEELALLYEKYIKLPCLYYVNELKSVFTLATFDSLFYHKVVENEEDFYLAWVHYKFCSRLPPRLEYSQKENDVT